MYGQNLDAQTVATRNKQNFKAPQASFDVQDDSILCQGASIPEVQEKDP